MKKQNLSANSEFFISPNYTCERTGDYKLRDAISSKWEYTALRLEGNGNCNSQFSFDIKNNTFLFQDKSSYDLSSFIPMYRIMSPALLLYRLICTFFNAPICYDGYKTVWEYNLTHKQTGKNVSFSEWKGAIGFWVADYTHTELSKEFKADLIELMNYIVSDKCAHPYDELVSGSVA